MARKGEQTAKTKQKLECYNYNKATDVHKPYVGVNRPNDC